MHQLFSPPPGSPLQRAFTLLLVLCMLCAGASPAALAARADQSACATYDLEACAQHNENSAERSSHFDLDKLFGQADLPIARSFRRWFCAASASDCGAHSAAQRPAPAHDPPKTILFCTLLI